MLVFKRDYFREKVYEGEGLTSEREGGKIKAYRKGKNDSSENHYLSEAQFNNLVIEAKKNGAIIIRDDPKFNERLKLNSASAATYGDALGIL